MGMSEVPPERSRWMRVISGWVLLSAGIAGCVLPVIPGIPLALAGLLVLSRDYAWARSLLRKAKRKAVSVRRKARARQSAPVVNGRSG
jgi:uncharacterized membrane protein YbaN (DUF454 family)